MTSANGDMTKNILGSHRFVVDLDKGKYNLGTWSKVSGLSVKWQKVSYRYGESNKDFVFAGNITLESLKLSRAACEDSKRVQEWLVTTSRNRQAFPGGVELQDYDGSAVVRWNFRSLFPIGWSITEIDATSGKPMIETLELAHSGFLDDQKKLRDR